MKRTAICPVCGKEFTAGRRTQLYCSSHCRRYAYRHRILPSPVQSGAETILRTFRCLQCGTIVRIIQKSDKRVKFCSPHCERLYWKHSKKKHVQAMSVSRTFRCRNCGKDVVVTEAKDRRMAFCSAECRVQWFSLHRKRKYSYIECES